MSDVGLVVYNCIRPSHCRCIIVDVCFYVL